MIKNKEKADKEKAYQIAEVILTFDQLVFPENPVKKVEIILDKPKEENQVISWFYYDYGDRGGEEHYDVFVPGICDFIKGRLEGEGRIPHLTMIEEKKAGQIKEKDLIIFSEEELIASIAAHEVRHRIQRHLLNNNDLFDKEKTAKIPNLYILGKVLSVLGNTGSEFDAKIIQFLIAKEYYLGNICLKNIKKTLTITPDDF